MISWQARTLRAGTRVAFKPFIRYCSIGVMRVYMAIVDFLIGIICPPKRCKDFRVEKMSYGQRLSPVGEHAETRRVILYLPGGAFLIRSPNAHRLLVQRICRAAGARADIIHYRLSPEFKFPAALEDAVAAYRRLLAEGIQSEQIVIAGDSAGGCLTLSTALRLRDLGEPMPAGLVTLSPVTDLTFSSDSRHRNYRKDPLLPAKRAHADARHYMGNESPENPLISPVFGDYHDLPPILFHVGSDEILLDDTLRVVEQAKRAGVPYDLNVWEKMPHVWHLFPQLPESTQAVAEIGAFVRNRVVEQTATTEGSTQLAQ